MNKVTDKFKNGFLKVKMFFEKLLFPDDIKCIFCGTDVPDFYTKPYCENCEKDLPLNNQNRCLICDEPIDNEAKVCDSCQKEKRYFKKAFCPFVYKDKVRSSILGYKDSNRRYLSKTFAKFIVEELNSSRVKIDRITYVPMTKKKEKQRSFNQSKLLAIEIGKFLNKPVIDLFEKTKDGTAQKFLTAKERAAAMKNLYVLKKQTLHRGENILIVDDIITTCATVNYCSALIHNKVNSVYVCAIARNKKLHQKSSDDQSVNK